MKSIQFILITAVYYLNSINCQKQAIEYLVDDITKQQCGEQKDNCLFFIKAQAIFPVKQKEGNETNKQHMDADQYLNEFNYKYIYIFKNSLSVFRAHYQNDELNDIPQHNQFLNNFPLSTIYTPCNDDMDICSIQDLFAQQSRPREIDFKIKEQVEYNFATDRQKQKQCLVISTDLMNDQQNYVCIKDLKKFQAFQYLLSKNIREMPFNEHFSLDFYNEQSSDWKPKQIYLNHTRLIISDNENLDLDESTLEKSDEKYELVKQLNDKAVQYYDQEVKIIIPDQKEQNRCLQIPMINRQDSLNKKKLYFCSQIDLENKKLEPINGSLYAKEFSNLFNRFLNQVFLQQLTEELLQVDESDDKAILSDDVKIILKEEISYYLKYFEKSCKLQQYKNMKDNQQCQKLKNESLIVRITDLCIKRVFCINEAKILLEQQIDNKYLDLPKPISQEQFQMALNTLRTKLDTDKFKVYEEQKDLKELEETIIKKTCTSSSLQEKALILPFVSDVDPWLNFFQYIYRKNND